MQEPWTSTKIPNRKNDALVLHKSSNQKEQIFLVLFGSTAPGPQVVNCCHNSFGSPVKDSSVIQSNKIFFNSQGTYLIWIQGQMALQRLPGRSMKGCVNWIYQDLIVLNHGLHLKSSHTFSNIIIHYKFHCLRLSDIQNM